VEKSYAALKNKIQTHNKNFIIKVKERKMVKKRGLASYILLSMITSGIYGMWRIHVLARDMNLMCEGAGKKTRGFLAFFFFGLITLGIYDLVWLYAVGDRLQDNAKRYNLAF
jgi:hypothetical protein